MDGKGIERLIRDINFRDILGMTFKTKTFFGNDKVEEYVGFVVDTLPLIPRGVWMSKKDPITDYPLRWRHFKYKSIPYESIISYKVL